MNFLIYEHEPAGGGVVASRNSKINLCSLYFLVNMLQKTRFTLPLSRVKIKTHDHQFP